ncbi:transglycosylase domain-containing protein [Azoarcus sp. L1K30]|uniref:transglycosylase domain-containing protein n=1 Tax=Azoarcus sp. L1K30 TaxID=2820277 RepID=UPI001B81B21E|nr:transglycosylase domain-containing protein [Azoarcus sp. L1K30]MBR0565271.1 transglycosylase domain-containing protein [Azoarcus sp. L1K30]
MQSTSKPLSKHRSFRLRWMLVTVLAAGLLVGGLVLVDELRTSALQARYLSRIAGEADVEMKPGAGSLLAAPGGPYDSRLGYSQLPAFVSRLATRGYTVSEQARPSASLVALSDLGVFPIYREKNQGGLALLDCRAQPLVVSRYPERTYASFDDVPPLLVSALLFIENRELLDPTRPKRNPAVEWDRFARAAFDQLAGMIDEDRSTPGGSTLATQIEKYRHSPDGRTSSREQKLKQMASASLRTYLEGEETLPARRRIVTDYLNTVPLSAKAGFGEVNGIGDGLWAWYGRDFDEVNRLIGRATRPISVASSSPDGEQPAVAAKLQAQALAFKQALSLMIAQRRPSYYLAGNAQGLTRLTDSHLRLLAQAGIIGPELRDAALALPLKLREGPASPPASAFVMRKAGNALRAHLAGQLGITRLYDLDRLDLTADTTLHGAIQTSVTEMLRSIGDPAQAAGLGLVGPRMFAPGQDPAPVLFSFTLYEHRGDANLLRIQTDSYDQPFDINEGAKLDLGSTAKLRTLVTYLEIVAELHERYAASSAAELRQIARTPSNPILSWALDYLAGAGNRSLRAMLDAAMQRSYSANPGEQFFTGGGVHTFENFNRDDDNKIMPVQMAFRHSVNLVFIRLMRDIVRYTISNNPAAAEMFDDPDDPRRKAYLNRFADREGRLFLNGFYRKYRTLDDDAALTRLLDGIRVSPRRLAVILRSAYPELDQTRFMERMRKHLDDTVQVSDSDLADLYARFSVERYALPDRGYLAGIHPLELWLLGYLHDHPTATLAEVHEASLAERQEVYGWLFRTRHRNAQDVRIRSLLEVEAFIDISQRWRRLGYPFESLTPSYATSIGSSADRPAALAELVGILVNDGQRLPTVRIERLHFAADTPYETVMMRTPGAGERVLPAEVAQVAREAMIDVATQGTARRLNGAFTAADGTPLVVGGKTGTGDHRFEVYGHGGALVSSRVVTRSATLIFFVGDRFFGTLTAFAAEPYAADYQFTSSLAVQLLSRGIAPLLKPLLGDADQDGPVTGCAPARPAMTAAN